jgi:hypothetical protein
MPFPDLNFFKAREFSHPDKMDPDFLVLLDRIREEAGVRMVITDSYRPNGSKSAHSLGLAVDVSDNSAGLAVGSRWRHKVLKAAFALGCERIGIYDRHIHIDASTTHDQEVCWYGSSE